jgi:hypothetical protein
LDRRRYRVAGEGAGGQNNCGGAIGILLSGHGESIVPGAIQPSAILFAEDGMHCGMLRTWPDDDAVKLIRSVNEPRWFVIRDRLSRAIEYRALEPRTNLRRVMDSERAEHWKPPTACIKTAARYFGTQ